MLLSLSRLPSVGDFTFWLSLWLRPKAELKLNLRTQLWSEPGLRIKYWLSPEFITIAPAVSVRGAVFTSGLQTLQNESKCVLYIVYKVYIV